MKTIILMLLMMFLSLGVSSCGSVTRKIVCNQIHDNEMKPLASGQISLHFKHCLARCIDPNSWEYLELTNCPNEFPEAKAGEIVRKYPIENCEGIVGFFIEDIATEIRPKVTALNRIKEDYCN